jgi:hypothetical protein
VISRVSVNLIMCTGGAHRAARPAFQRGFELPDRGIPRPPYRIEGKAGASLTAIAFHFEPAETAVQALRDRGRRLRGPAVSFHSD